MSELLGVILVVSIFYAMTLGLDDTVYVDDWNAAKELCEPNGGVWYVTNTGIYGNHVEAGCVNGAKFDVR